MSLVARDHHYIRDGLDAERLFDLAFDPFEMKNLIDQADGKQKVKVFRQMLLDFLADNQGSVEIEEAYLKRFKDRLRAQVKTAEPSLETASAK